MSYLHSPSAQGCLHYRLTLSTRYGQVPVPHRILTSYLSPVQAVTLLYRSTDVNGPISCDPTRPDPTHQISSQTRFDPPITSKILTRPDQPVIKLVLSLFVMTPKVGFSKYSFNIFSMLLNLYSKCQVL